MLALALAACSASTPSARARILLPALPPQVARETPRPVNLPPGPLNQVQTETLWARDRSELSACRVEKGAIVDFYGQLQRGLAGEGK